MASIIIVSNTPNGARALTEKGKMEILIDNRQNSHRPEKGKIRAKAEIVLNALEYPEAELSVVLVDDEQIEFLNREYLGRNGPTNVIAFPMREGDFQEISPNVLGDVVISMDTAYREGKTAGIGMEKRFDELLVHGILHLLGYDHEKSMAEEERMDKKSRQLIEAIHQKIS
jgi:probable rRNA maturation factor